MRQDQQAESAAGCIRTLLVAVGIFLTVVLGLVRPVSADADARPLTGDDRVALLPGADVAGPFQGEPPAAELRRDGRLVGYAFSTYATVRSTGYSGKPLDVLVGLDLQGMITGARLVRQTEPILVIGISEQQIRDYVGGFAGIDIGLRGSLTRSTDGTRYPQPISGATISSAVIRDAVVRSARAVAASRGLGVSGGVATGIDTATFAPASWVELAADGSVVCRSFSRRDLADAAQVATSGGDDRLAEVCISLLAPPRVGENLLGKLAFSRLVARLAVDDQALLIAANGLFSVKGTAFTRSKRFERLQIVQGEHTIPLTTEGYANVETLRTGDAPAFREAGIFVVPAGTSFDPIAPWRLDILVSAEASPAGTPALLTVDYVLPERYRLTPSIGDRSPASAVPLWQQNWRSRLPAVIAVSGMLAALTTILVFQDAVIQRPRLYRRFRLAFLAATLGWLGWVAGGQLSVVNVLTFAHSLMTDFQWEFFLLDPLIFILWSYVAVVLLFWGRGVYCGWLCPFGALQELLNEVARRLRIPQLRLPFSLHERLWPLKYTLFLGLFAVSLTSTEFAFIGAEVEPFKTAISLKFVRAWPFVLYAAGLLVAGLFVERFFCRYLCPLGAALAIPARLRMFEWLKRRPQCGRECQICFHHCPVQAIHPEGQINPNECIHCLLCQRIYADDHMCPPLAARRKRRERREALSAGSPVTMTEETG
ncbi:MAG: 4Fe-4S binding protein [Rhodospirillales bacterium]